MDTTIYDFNLKILFRNDATINHNYRLWQTRSLNMKCTSLTYVGMCVINFWFRMQSWKSFFKNDNWHFGLCGHLQVRLNLLEYRLYVVVWIFKFPNVFAHAESKCAVGYRNFVTKHWKINAANGIITNFLGSFGLQLIQVIRVLPFC